MNWQTIIDATPCPSGLLGESLWWAQYEYNCGIVDYAWFIQNLNEIFDCMVSV